MKLLFKNKGLLIILFLFFFVSHTNVIKGGVCAFSPCTGWDMNESEMQIRHDYFISTRVSYLLAPTGLLIRPLISSNDVLVDTWPNRFRWSDLYNQEIKIDHKEDQYSMIRQNREVNDDIRLLWIFIFVELIILLSFPLWFFLSKKFVQWAKSESLYKKSISYLFILLLLIFSGFKIYFLIDPIFLGGESPATFEFIKFALS